MIAVLYCTQAMAPRTHITPHHGPTNKKLRCHLPLVVPHPEPVPLPSMLLKGEVLSVGADASTLPVSTTDDLNTTSTNATAKSLEVQENTIEKCRLRCEKETVLFKEGECIVFDDSFEHETVNPHGSQPRVVLIVDFWHPDLTDEEVRYCVVLHLQM